jgi:hypothetical protein
MTTKDTKYHEGFVRGRSFVILRALRGKGFRIEPSPKPAPMDKTRSMEYSVALI